MHPFFEWSDHCSFEKQSFTIVVNVLGLIHSSCTCAWSSLCSYLSHNIICRFFKHSSCMMHLFCGLCLFPCCFHILVLAIFLRFYLWISWDSSFDLLFGRSTYISMSVYVCMYIIFILRLCASQKTLDPVLMSMSLCTFTFISIWVMGQQ